jgi:hypothetical protein
MTELQPPRRHVQRLTPFNLENGFELEIAAAIFCRECGREYPPDPAPMNDGGVVQICPEGHLLYRCTRVLSR